MIVEPARNVCVLIVIRIYIILIGSLESKNSSNL